MTSKKEQMIAMRQQGMKYKDIAEIFGCSRQYVATVCGKADVAHFRHCDSIYPNIQRWMNENKVSMFELLRRMGLMPYSDNLDRLRRVIRGQTQPKKDCIDRLIKVTGMTYEVLFAEVENGN